VIIFKAKIGSAWLIFITPDPAHADKPIRPIGAALVEYCLEQAGLL